tara:strand:- start:78 stop:515 length:438 start_codon:yes stop_codon:yes gene_type:complete
MRLIVPALCVVLITLVCESNAENIASETPVSKLRGVSQVVFVTLGEMQYVSDDSTYCNQVLEVPQMTQNVMDSGGVLAFIERPEREDRPQRWSQLPQLALSGENPTFIYLSHGLGLVRLSYQSSTSIKGAMEYSRDKRLKLVIFE